MSESPSEQSRMRSPATMGSTAVSTSTSSSAPRARVMRFFWGCSAAWSLVRSPLRTSSATSEWSSVIGFMSPPRTRYALESPTCATSATGSLCVPPNLMATTVVPIPESFSSVRPAATILRFASVMAVRKGSSGWRPLSTSTARELASSPASKPPMPSATTKSVSSLPSPTSRASSLFWRTLPASVTPNGCNSRKGKILLLVPEGGRAYPDGIPVSQGRRAHGLAPVHESPVGRVEVLHVEQPAVPGELGVAPRGVVVALQDDGAARGASDAGLAVPELEPRFGGQDLRVLDHQLRHPRDGAPAGVRPASVVAPAGHVRLIVRYLPQVPDAPAHYGVDKGEEQQQKQGFRREQRHLELEHVLTPFAGLLARRVYAADEAGRALAEGQLVAAFDPLAVDGGSVEQGAVRGAEVLDHEAVVGAGDPGMLPRHVGVVYYDVVLLRAAYAPRAAPFERMDLIPEGELDDLPRQTVAPGLVGGDGGGALVHLPSGRLLGAEDAGLARGVLRGTLLAGAVAARQLGGDAELPEAERVLRLEAYPRGGHEVVVLVLGVGRGVLDQLVLQRSLVGPDGLRVFFGEVNREVVRGIGARDRNHRAFVHLLGKALGDLYGMDLPPERSSTDALYQRFHPLFDVFEKTQRNLPSHPHHEVPEHPLYYSRETERNHIQSEGT